MRYLLFSYSYNAEGKDLGIGTLTVSSEGFPSRGFLIDEAMKTLPSDSSVLITGWTEFKTVEDYEDFLA